MSSPTHARPPLRRVVVTGMGAVTPIGNSWSDTWANMLRGVSGIAPLTNIECDDLPVRIGGEVKDFDPEQFLSRKVIRRTDRSVHMALAATVMALDEAKLEIDEELAERVGVVVGSASGPVHMTATARTKLDTVGPRGISAFCFSGSSVDSAASEIALLMGAQGNAYCVSTACATGATAIAEASRMIQTGEADVVIAGGTDDTLTRVELTSAAISRALSRSDADPQRVCRPFDKARDGFVMSAGAGVVVLESAEHAQARHATVIGELAGSGSTTDAHHITAPHPEGKAAVRAMRMALAQAGATTDDVDYINAHGTSTKLNDTTEVLAIRKVFGDRAPKIPVSSVKSMTGHMLGGAGAVELITALETIRSGIVPPTINCDDPEDPEMNFVPHRPQEHAVRSAMSNSFGFGGHNVVLLVREWCP
ncbi:beta-ketoacyl-ACP synthase II [Saccharomonospora sp. NB11]|jgi:3-oxoacyl-[acyl-carrier-protein] synthase II|uniref:beta-ketoacyl-ACP synthase II n=1 Tax=Saccharomonospora sp. NB11 TaxID=1642298 RepID=UPI0018D18B63|nr:beta-ketoacyl-ACP synthase II [Saccharomonospora sp. NB11]